MDITPIEVSEYTHLNALPSDALQLFAVAELQHVEHGAPWFHNLVDTVFPDDDRVRIYVSRREGKPIAAMPVLLPGRNWAAQAESLSNYYTSIYSPAMADGCGAQDLASIITAICATRPGSLKFAPMDPKSTGYRMLLDALKIAKLMPYEYFCFGNWYLNVTGDWAAYWKGRRANLRSTVKRMGTKFTADQGRIELVRDPRELGRAMVAYSKVYHSSWKKPEPYPSFVSGLAQICAESGWLRLAIAWLGETPIAAQLWIVVGEKANIYKVAYDEQYKAYAPGSLLTAMLMEHVIEKDHVKEVDFLIGDDPYKGSWMSDRRERWGIVAYNPRTLPGLWGLCTEIVGRASKDIRTRLRQWKNARGN
jgi:hypothetical protein